MMPTHEIEARLRAANAAAKGDGVSCRYFLVEPAAYSALASSLDTTELEGLVIDGVPVLTAAGVRGGVAIIARPGGKPPMALNVF